MCNCNQKRQQFSSGQKRVQPNTSSMGMGQVRLTQDEPLLLYGDVTGKEYAFQQKNQILWVDKSDINYLKHREGIEVLA